MTVVWSTLQTAGPGILITIVATVALYLGVRALTAQALEGDVSEYEIRVRLLGLHVRWSKNTSQAEGDEGIDPPSAQGVDSPSGAPSSSGGGAKA